MNKFLFLLVFIFISCSSYQKHSFFDEVKGNKTKICVQSLAYKVSDKFKNEDLTIIKNSFDYWNSIFKESLFVYQDNSSGFYPSVFDPGFFYIEYSNAVKSHNSAEVNRFTRFDGCIQSGKINIRKEAWSNIDDISKISIMRHEIGHIIGMNNISDDGKFLMSYYIEENMKKPKELTYEEIYHICTVYTNRKLCIK